MSDEPILDLFRVLYEADPTAAIPAGAGERSQYLGTFTERCDLELHHLKDACERTGIDPATARELALRFFYDYMAINWELPPCCEGHDHYLNELKASPEGAAPMRMEGGRPPRH